MTPKERAAMQQALEALHNTQNALLFVSGSIEQFIISNMTADAHDDADKAITALREALGNSLKPKCFADYQPNHAIDRVCASCAVAVECQTGEQAEQEPVARVAGYYGGRCVVEPLNRATVLPTDMALYAAPVQQVTRADLKAAFKEGFERAADLYALKDGQEPYAYEVWDVQDQSFTMIYATQLKEFHWIEPENIARVLYTAPVPITTPDVCGEVCVRAKLCYGCGKALDEANAKLAEQAECPHGVDDGACKECYMEQTDYFDYGLEEVEDYLRNCCNNNFMADKLSDIRKSIYAAPVRTKDLTDKQIEKVWNKNGGYMGMPIDFARAVIAADREKNK